MTVRFRVLLTAALVGGLLAPSAAEALPRFYGKVGPGSTIALRRADGTLVRQARPGRKTFVIRDRSSAHNFHLTGPGVDKRTGLAFIGRRVWSPVRLRVGTYTILCDSHPSDMRRTFRVS
jgi:hypothetical protein